MTHTTSLTTTTADPDETRAVGAALGRVLAPGDVVLLSGDLGAGKTTLVQGLARGAGSDELVNSPTFVLVNEYRGRLTIYHADLYRLEGIDEVAALDLPDTSNDGVLVVEWPERGREALPSECVEVRLEHGGGDRRTLTLIAHGERAAELVRGLAAVSEGVRWN